MLLRVYVYTDMMISDISNSEDWFWPWWWLLSGETFRHFLQQPTYSKNSTVVRNTVVTWYSEL